MATKKIKDLTLAQLKVELGKRGIDKTGDRSVLLAKLRRVCILVSDIHLPWN